MSPTQRILQCRFEERAFDNYLHLIQRLEPIIKRLTERHSYHLTCFPGCSYCCHNVIGVWPVEAFFLQHHIRQATEDHLSLIKKNLRTSTYCPLLIDDKCSLYAYRPVICRTHGLPLLHEFEEDDPAIDYCEFNFVEVTPGFIFRRNESINLNNLNTALASVNMVFIRDHAQINSDDNPEWKIPPEIRLTIAEICQSVLDAIRE
ncbi:MAG: hypothetical protein B6244_09220 [Candidatus Cloacimonetes bacterium 4572_55]|nr:MAG: hypothetical protein B6244_09220 [Candidatus Cloacimonetes bacterium 4572_55]